MFSAQTLLWVGLGLFVGFSMGVIVTALFTSGLNGEDDMPRGEF